MQRDSINNCPQQATHVKLNPSKQFIELFYKKNESGLWVFLSTCGGGWQYSFEQEKDKNFEDRLILIEA